ncbi:MAG: helix-turn-helix domain-containing protein [Anaerolineaceae bacterium]
MKHKPFSRLRGEMQANDIDIPYLAHLLGGSESSIGRRLRGTIPWTLDEMYQIMDILRWPHERMHEMFPNDLQDKGA